jgi:hypothetical protein
LPPQKAVAGPRRDLRDRPRSWRYVR